MRRSMATNGDAGFPGTLQTTQRINAKSNLRARMFQAGISQADLAKAADMNKATVAAAMKSGRNVKALTLNKLLLGYNELVLARRKGDLQLEFPQMFPPHLGGYAIDPGRDMYDDDNAPTRSGLVNEPADDEDPSPV
jgi:transcriptional regulator with XRE-family HTH domain